MKARAIAIALMALALAVGYTAAAASSTPAQTGTAAVTVSYMEHGFHGVVKVFNAAGRVVAHHRVRNDHGSLDRTEHHFRFALKPGRYKVKLEMKKRWRYGGCKDKGTVRVRASNTTHILLEENCLNPY